MAAYVADPGQRAKYLRRRQKEIAEVRDTAHLPFSCQCISVQETSTGWDLRFDLFLPSSATEEEEAVRGILISVPFSIFARPTVQLPLMWLCAHPKTQTPAPLSGVEIDSLGQVRMCDWTSAGHIRDALAAAYLFLLETR